MQSNQRTDGDVTQKLARIEGYLNIDPQNPELLATAIDLNLSLKKISEARRWFEAANTFHPGDQFFQSRYGNILIAEGNLDEANRVVRRLYEETGSSAVGFNLAYIYFLQRDFAGAQTLLGPLITKSDATAEMMILFLRLLHQQGNVEQAIASAEPHMAAYGDDGDFLAVVSLLYLDAGRMGDARNLNAAARALGSHCTEAMVVEGTIAVADGNAVLAKSNFQDSVAANPVEGRGWMGLGLSNFLENDLTSAAEHFEKALQFLPSHIGSWHALGWCKILSNDLVQAETIFQHALSLDRNFSESHGGLAVVSALKGDIENANGSIDRAIKLDPQCVSARYAQAVISGERNDPEKFSKIVRAVLSNRRG